MPSTKDNAKDTRREKMGFEMNPPVCRNCVHFMPAQSTEKRSPWCKKGFFGVSPTSICDRWQGHDGSRLEK